MTKDCGIVGPLDVLRSRGWLVLEDVVPTSLVGRIDAALRELEVSLVKGRPASRFEGGGERPTNLLGKNEVFLEVATFAPLMAIAHELLGDGFLLNSMASLVVEPGTPVQHLHSDDQVIRLGSSRPTVICTTIWALDDFSVSNGATEIVEGTHELPEPLRWGNPYDLENNRRPVEMSRGSVLVMDGRIYHGAGANSSSSERRAIGMSYCAGFIRPVENQLLGIQMDTLRTFSPELLRLCGLCIYDGIINHVDRREPLEILKERWAQSLK